MGLRDARARGGFYFTAETSLAEVVGGYSGLGGSGSVRMLRVN